MKTRLFLIRHGETEWTRRKRYCGSNDIPLNATGREQARRLAEKMGRATFDRIYCSDLSRCTGLAATVFGKRAVIREPRLREMNFGVFEGLKHATLLKRFPRIYPRWLKEFGSVTPPEGESFTSFQARVRAAFRQIIAENKGKTCAIVTHGGVLMVVFAALVGKDRIWKFLPSLASVTLMEINNGRKKLVYFNDTSHLSSTPVRCRTNSVAGKKITPDRCKTKLVVGKKNTPDRCQRRRRG